MMARKQFEFVGSTATRLSLDPTEYTDWSVDQIADDLIRTLKAVSPGVDFYYGDVIGAANELAGG